MNLYKVLEVEVHASLSDIKRKFQELSKIYHPDKAGKLASEEKFIKILHAWEILGDSYRRQEYDKQLIRDTLYQQHPINEELYWEDLDFNKEENSYYQECRCGGCFKIDKNTVFPENQLVVPCDNCSLAVIIKEEFETSSAIEKSAPDQRSLSV